MGYILTGMLSYASGFLAGIIWEWNKKVLFWIMTALVALLLILTLIAGEEVEQGFSILRMLFGTLLTTIGLWTGIYFYKATFEKK